jgi:hypothetical protein
MVVAMKKNGENTLRCIIRNKELKTYDEEEIEISERSFLSVLEAFQVAVFSFLMATNKRGYRSFGELVKIFDDYFDKFKLEKTRLSRALDICLDIGFLNAKWKEDKKTKQFQRKFRNKHEVSHVFKQISNNYKKGRIEKNAEIFGCYQ